MPLNFVLSQRVVKKLEHDGFYYNYYRVNKSGVTSWRCDVAGCKGTALTDSTSNDGIVKTSHTHAVVPKSTKEIK